MRFVVIGAGAIGGVVGGRLAASGFDVVLVARGAHAEAIERDGLEVRAPDRADVVRAPVARTPAEVGFADGDVALLAVKSQHTVGLLDELFAVAGPGLPVVCLQNGVFNEREALRRFRDVYGATVMCPTAHFDPGRVLAYSTPTAGIIDVGRSPTGADEIAGSVVAALGASTFSSRVLDDVTRWKYCKLLTNLGNAIEAVCGPDARGGRLAELVRSEGEAVLAAAGIDHATEAEDAERRDGHLTLARIDGERRPGGSSWQSLARGLGTIETDYLNGEIVMLGREHGVATPANEALQLHAHRLAAIGAPPGAVSEDELLAGIAR